MSFISFPQNVISTSHWVPRFNDLPKWITYKGFFATRSVRNTFSDVAGIGVEDFTLHKQNVDSIMSDCTYAIMNGMCIYTNVSSVVYCVTVTSECDICSSGCTCSVILLVVSCHVILTLTRPLKCPSSGNGCNSSR